VSTGTQQGRGLASLLAGLLAGSACGLGLVQAAAPPPPPPPLPRVFGCDPAALAAVRARVATHDPVLRPAWAALTNAARKELKRQPVSVTEKPQAPASGDKHDYFSLAPYFWPDPAKPEGLPYVRRDGRRNPETAGEHSDAARLDHTATAVHTLALAYYLGGREEHAAHAVRLLRVFFLDAATRMNPNFNHAQAVPGRNTGRGTGMIESRSLPGVCDAAGLLARSTNWTRADQEGLEQWMGGFLDWALTSAHGQEERAARNNHGTFYDAQVAHLALFCGRTNLAREIIASAATNRLDRQIAADGRQPLELARQDSFAYSRFNLFAMFEVATLGDRVGLDLWRHTTPEGAGMRRVLDHLLDYAEDPAKPWPWEKDKKESRTLEPRLLRQAFLVYGDPRYRRALDRLGHAPAAVDALLFPLP
jgi:hypothetical protein